MSYLDERKMRLEYALSKQLDSPHSLSTNYGDLELDYEMKEAIKKVLEPMLRKKIRQIDREIRDLDS